LLLFYGVIGL